MLFTAKKGCFHQDATNSKLVASKKSNFNFLIWTKNLTNIGFPSHKSESIMKVLVDPIRCDGMNCLKRISVGRFNDQFF